MLNKALNNDKYQIDGLLELAIRAAFVNCLTLEKDTEVATEEMLKLLYESFAKLSIKLK